MAKKKKKGVSEKDKIIAQLERKIEALEARVSEAETARTIMRKWLGLDEIESVEHDLSSLEVRVEELEERNDEGSLRETVEEIISNATISV